MEEQSSEVTQLKATVAELTAAVQELKAGQTHTQYRESFRSGCSLGLSIFGTPLSDGIALERPRCRVEVRLPVRADGEVWA